MHKYMFFREPTNDKDPTGGFLPVLRDRVHFLDVTNDELRPGVDPNQQANQFWADIEQQIQQLNTDKRIDSHKEL